MRRIIDAPRRYEVFESYSLLRYLFWPYTAVLALWIVFILSQGVAGAPLWFITIIPLAIWGALLLVFSQEIEMVVDEKNHTVTRRWHRLWSRGEHTYSAGEVEAVLIWNTVGRTPLPVMSLVMANDRRVTMSLPGMVNYTDDLIEEGKRIADALECPLRQEKYGIRLGLKTRQDVLWQPDSIS